MAEYIEREAAIKALKGLPTWWGDGGGWYGHAQPPMVALLDPLDAVNAIDNIPAADVVPVVRGKWIPDYDYTEYDYDGSTPLPEPLKFQDGWQCSLCGGYMPSETNFCPNCGARMDGDGE